jgi:2'-hydroxyisoflavone reductase
MDALVLGGTSFVGRWIVQDLLSRGHRVTLFSRGQTGPGLFPDVERRVGDRQTGDYASLAGGRWDAVVDVSGYVPRHVGQALDALEGRTGRYLFISTGSVYDATQVADDLGDLAEDCPRLAPWRETEEITGETYGRLKVACEDDLLARRAERATIVRPGIVAGPHDPTDRFTYWVRRASRGGRVALPGRPEQRVQVVDARDLARLVVLLLEQDRPGVFNAVGPWPSVTLAGLVRTCALGADLELVPVGTTSVDFPLVAEDPAREVLFHRSAAAAHAVGMPMTPLEQTAADTLAWDLDRGQPPLVVGPTPEQEQELLASRGGP